MSHEVEFQDSKFLGLYYLNNNNIQYYVCIPI